jgi:hypothetical protein
LLKDFNSIAFGASNIFGVVSRIEKTLSDAAIPSECY